MTQSAVEVVRGFFRSAALGDTHGIRQYLRDDTRWTVPGRHPLAGTHHGPVEIAALFRELHKASFVTKSLFLAADGNHVVEVHTGRSNTGDAADVETLWAMIFTVEDGKIREARGFVADQYLADNFFARHYSLAPLPGRLAAGQPLQGDRTP